MNLLSDAAQSQTWSKIAPLITPGKTLYFSHGFSVVYKEDTHVVPPKDVDVILVAPKGSGRTVRTLFKEGRGINSSIAVWQDVTGKAKEKAVALGVGIGSGYMYETTFEKEVYSDLYGERGVVSHILMALFFVLMLIDVFPYCLFSLWVLSVSSISRVFMASSNFRQRVFSWLSTKSSAKTVTAPRKLSTKLSKRLPNPFTL